MKCDKCNDVMNFKNELTVDKKKKKSGVKVSCIPCMFLIKSQIKISILRKNQVAIWLLKLMNN